MNDIRGNKWFIVAFILLVALNIATLAAFFLFRRPDKIEVPRGGGAADYLARELHFDSAQKKKLFELVDEHRHQMGEMRAQNRDAKDAFFSLLRQGEISDSALAIAVRDANHPEQQMDMITFRHFQKVRALCDPQQRERFDEVISEVLRMNAGPPPGEGPPGRP